MSKDRATLEAEVARLQSRLDSENKHWEAWEVYQGSGNLDNHHSRVFHDYVDGLVSREYMTVALSRGTSPCDHDYDYTYDDPNRPKCQHCNRDGRVES